ncbi:MAG: chemotaxis protein CheW [Gammaproteobacteria bacterium]
MEEFVKSSEDIVRITTSKSSSRSTWLDAQTELITRLESEYEISDETKQDQTVIRHYGFRIGGLNLLITEDLPCEVLEENNFYSVPLAPKWLVGTCNVRGDIVPIVDLEHILTGNTNNFKPNEYKTFIIGNAENAMGLLLNKLPIPIHFKKYDQISDFSELPKLVQPSVNKAYKKNQEIWSCIDFASLLAALTNKQSM